MLCYVMLCYAMHRPIAAADLSCRGAGWAVRRALVLAPRLGHRANLAYRLRILSPGTAAPLDAALISACLCTTAASDAATGQRLD